uniref:ABC transporter domain-containing protein n=1 Tax=Strigamia maritima TaxID=126957 RepID=T1J7I3_STRMM
MDIKDEKNLAVSLQQVHSTYGIGCLSKIRVLKNVTINVTQGTIFGILGPSGCGKTTLLKCVIANLKPNNGTVKVLNETPGSAASTIPGSGIGYMPQGTGLLMRSSMVENVKKVPCLYTKHKILMAVYQDLTIKEIMFLFGRLHHMKKKDIESRIEFLLEFLNLPRTKKLVKNYSGGELRQISFAIALLHQPPLLILDEPTVGVDPILRKSIWNYLVKISLDENVTIIITTHYIEEARQANQIAFMRDGRILVQDEPDALINQYNAATLEDVFLILCEKDSNTQDETNNIAGIHFTRIKAMTILSFIKMWRNYVQVLFSFTFLCKLISLIYSLMALQFLNPVLQLTFIFWSMGTEPRHIINVAVFNQDTIFGPRYLHYINNETIQMVPVDSIGKGEDLVRGGKAWAVINILPNFTTALMT